ncbi:MAG: hypothetical protein NT120_02450 [Candidatus Aenigmarchaeota archaeon]|nr:hypothetical protein [Candidatus Aenigmarchaeota archaeon]
MSKIFLITRPEHEYRVAYLHAWSKEILDFALKRNIKFTDFDKKQSTRENVEKYLRKRRPEFVIFNGHGPEDSTAILGHNDEAIIKAGKNTALLKDTIVYARACFSTKVLGNEVISNGGKSYIGYSGPFSWVHSSDRECNPFKDKIAEPFKMISNMIPLSILDGHTTLEAHNRAKNLCLKLLQDFSSTGNDNLDKEIRFWLYVDMNIQEHLGDSDATF